MVNAISKYLIKVEKIVRYLNNQQDLKDLSYENFCRKVNMDNGLTFWQKCEVKDYLYRKIFLNI